MRKAIAALSTGLALLAAASNAAGNPPPLDNDPLLLAFLSPPQSAKPRVWWHWMNGNVSKDGIRRDLDWMHRVGIGGINAIDASLATPQVVDKRLIYMTPEWQDAFRYAVGLADTLGLEMSIDSSPGWSETGGPWVTPQQAMKKLVWSETRIEGGKPFHGILQQPPANSGPIQNAPMREGPFNPPAKDAALSFYRDAIVVAYRAATPSPHIAQVDSSNGALDPTQLSDGDLRNGPTLAPPKGGTEVWVKFSYARPSQLQAITLAASAEGASGAAAVLEASDDGDSWRSVAVIPSVTLPLHTVSFAPVTARFFRVTLSPAEPEELPGIFTNHAPGAASNDLFAKPASVPLRYHLNELVLHARATVNEAEAKAKFSIAPDYYRLASADVAPGTAVRPSDVLVVTEKMKADGTLNWTPPPGQWVVLRMGYSPLGTENHPAPVEATGLEVDKLNRDHVHSYMQRYLDMYEQVTGPELFGRKGVNALTVDSTEIGAQNWTESILSDFRQLRGYDPTFWLPALAGVTVGSPEDSDKFLWDFRRTIDQLLARNHYGEIAAMARERGLTTYGEALEDRRPTFGDDMEMRQNAAIPMAAMWTYGTRRESFPTYVADIRGAASVAHIYGQNIVAAESMTSAMQPWAYAPRQLKPIVDLEFALGVNRVVVHTSVHQPVDKPPGLSLFIFGQFFNRLENWADFAEPWVTYMARSSYLLQQGRYAGDVAYFYGEEAPLTGLFGDQAIDVPPGYGFDFVNSDVLLNELLVDGGLRTRSGMHYRVLYLGGTSRYMTMPVLRRIRDLVAEGAVLVGRKPLASPSLADDAAQFKSVADDLFGSNETNRAFGKGHVYVGSLEDAFAALKLPPDFDYTKPEADTEILALHRELDRGDLYFLTNRLNRAERVTATFRVSGRAPELWNAVTGKISPVGYRMVNGETQIPLSLGPYDSAFVLFRRPTTVTEMNIGEATKKPLITLAGPWNIEFQRGRGAPDRITESVLKSWSENPQPGVRYFSGTAVYTTTFVLPAGGKNSGAHLAVDLGDLREVAEVSLNDRALGILWNPPFEWDITDAVRAGKNRLQVKVANLWVNRLIGDAQPEAKTKYTFTTIPTYEPSAPLRSSGLLGPVQILEIPP
jgi:alpha-L-rhamnosidase